MDAKIKARIVKYQESKELESYDDALEAVCTVGLKRLDALARYGKKEKNKLGRVKVRSELPGPYGNPKVKATSEPKTKAKPKTKKPETKKPENEASAA